MRTSMRTLVKSSTLVLALVASSACVSAPKYHSWSKHTDSSWDDREPYITRESLEQHRAAALTQSDPISVVNYGYRLSLFIWENREFLAAAKQAATDPESSYVAPERLAGFDQDTYLAEYRAAIRTIYDNYASYGESSSSSEVEDADFLLDLAGVTQAIATLDCKAVLATQLPAATCSRSMIDWDAIKNLCSANEAAIDAMCAKAFEASPDLDNRFWLMDACGDNTSGENREAVARWANEEQLAFYDRMLAKYHEEREAMYAEAQMRAAAAQDENQRRLDAYAAQQDEYEANRGAIEDHSQIGSLDPNDRPPDAPELITSVSVDFSSTPTGWVEVPPAQLTFVSKCAETLQVTVGDKPAFELPANAEVTQELPMCATDVCVYDGEKRELDCLNVYESATYELLETCRHIRRVRDFG